MTGHDMSQREVPFGINTAVGAVAVAVLCLVPANLDQQGRDARLAVLAVGVVVFAATVLDPLAVAVTAGVGFLLFDGFVEGQQGDLVWNGRSDLLRLAFLCGSSALGLILGAVHRWRRHRRVDLGESAATSWWSAAALPPAESSLDRVPRQRKVDEPMRDKR
jgi:hypothetical protein